MAAPGEVAYTCFRRDCHAVVDLSSLPTPHSKPPHGHQAACPCGHKNNKYCAVCDGFFERVFKHQQAKVDRGGLHHLNHPPRQNHSHRKRFYKFGDAIPLCRCTGKPVRSVVTSVPSGEGVAGGAGAPSHGSAPSRGDRRGTGGSGVGGEGTGSFGSAPASIAHRGAGSASGSAALPPVGGWGRGGAGRGEGGGGGGGGGGATASDPFDLLYDSWETGPRSSSHAPHAATASASKDLTFGLPTSTDGLLEAFTTSTATRDHAAPPPAAAAAGAAGSGGGTGPEITFHVRTRQGQDLYFQFLGAGPHLIGRMQVVMPLSTAVCQVWWPDDDKTQRYLSSTQPHLALGWNDGPLGPATIPYLRLVAVKATNPFEYRRKQVSGRAWTTIVRNSDTDPYPEVTLQGDGYDEFRVGGGKGLYFRIVSTRARGVAAVLASPPPGTVAAPAASPPLGPSAPPAAVVPPPHMPLPPPAAPTWPSATHGGVGSGVASAGGGGSGGAGGAGAGAAPPGPAFMAPLQPATVPVPSTAAATATLPLGHGSGAAVGAGGAAVGGGSGGGGAAAGGLPDLFTLAAMHGAGGMPPPIATPTSAAHAAHQLMASPVLSQRAVAGVSTPTVPLPAPLGPPAAAAGLDIGVVLAPTQPGALAGEGGEYKAASDSLTSHLDLAMSSLRISHTDNPADHLTSLMEDLSVQLEDTR